MNPHHAIAKQEQHGLRHTIEVSGCADSGQVIHIWHGASTFWLELKDCLDLAFEDDPRIQMSFDVNYPREFPSNDAPPLPIPCCYFIIGKDGHEIAPDVLRVLREEYDALSAEFEEIPL